MGAAASYPIFTEHGAYDFARPDLADLTIDEVAVSLSRLYRWRGAIPVTVAQHSCAMAECAASEHVARWCLLHDVSEVLLGDAPAPLKALRAMEPFRRAEERIMDAVVERFGLKLPEPSDVKRLDLRARRSEVDEFLPHARQAVKGVRPLPIKLTPAWSPARAREEFRREARRLEIA